MTSFLDANGCPVSGPGSIAAHDLVVSTPSTPERVFPELLDAAVKLVVDQLGATPARPDRAPMARSRVVLRCTPEFHSWLSGLADWVGLNLTDTVHQSLRKLSETSGYMALIPRRHVPQPRRDPTR